MQIQFTEQSHGPHFMLIGLLFHYYYYFNQLVNVMSSVITSQTFVDTTSEDETLL